MQRYTKVLIGIAIMAGCTLVTLAWGHHRATPEVREFLIKARQYAYNPEIIRVNKGDEVHIKLMSLDVIHGFFLEGYDIDAKIEPGRNGFKMRHPSTEKEYYPVEEIVFVADRPGKFRFRCSHTCGYLHPFMLGEMVVGPNYPYLAGIGAVVGVALTFFSLRLVGGGQAMPSPAESDATQGSRSDGE